MHHVMSTYILHIDYNLKIVQQFAFILYDLLFAYLISNIAPISMAMHQDYLKGIFWHHAIEIVSRA